MSDSPSTVPVTTGGAPSRRLEMDNLIRRELRVGDPRDPKQIAQALMQRYAETAQARSLINEAKGMPFLQTVTLAAAPAAVPTATSLDLQQARNDIEADLEELLGSNQLKDMTPELEGWAHALRAAVADGEHAAAQGIDTRQRDKTFAIRRLLGDYARAARLVGTLNPRAGAEFRSLAQSLDEASAVLLVMMGESIANTGIAGGRYLMQVPFGELQTRREAVLHALRNLNGASQHAWGPSEWPRGVDAYRQLFEVLERQGQGDLRSLLTEHGMARVMDQLIDRAGQGVNGLRALGATALIELQQFKRLIAAIHWGVHGTASPPLVALQEALQLFIDGFTATGGIRLLGIARPQILSYGLYGNRSVSDLDDRLSLMLRLRGELAAQADCFASCARQGAAMKSQVLVDQSLYGLDRAIDLYAVGVGATPGEPEIRAATYGYVMDVISHRVHELDEGESDGLTSLLEDASTGARALLVAPLGGLLEHAGGRNLLLQELQLLRQQEMHLADMASQLGDGCGSLHDLYGDTADTTVKGEIPLVLDAAGAAIGGQHHRLYPPPIRIRIPNPLEVSNDLQVGGLLRQEIREYRDKSAQLAGQIESASSALQAREAAAETASQAYEEAAGKVLQAVESGDAAALASASEAVKKRRTELDAANKTLSDTEGTIALAEQELGEVKERYAPVFDYRLLNEQLHALDGGSPRQFLAVRPIPQAAAVAAGATAGRTGHEPAGAAPPPQPLDQLRNMAAPAFLGVQPPARVALPRAPSRTAMELNAWLAQVLAMVLDRQQVSPGHLRDNLATVDQQRPDVARTLASLRVQREDGSTTDALEFVNELLIDPMHDPLMAQAGPDQQAQHAAFDLLCARRAAALTALMARVATEVTGDDGAREREYADHTATAQPKKAAASNEPKKQQGSPK